jgi:hypothetical protein
MKKTAYQPFISASLSPTLRNKISDFMKTSMKVMLSGIASLLATSKLLNSSQRQILKNNGKELAERLQIPILFTQSNVRNRRRLSSGLLRRVVLQKFIALMMEASKTAQQPRRQPSSYSPT